MPRNIVRIRAIVPTTLAGVPVYFRSFDVDDPSADGAIDPNGNGSDNRGRLAPGLAAPLASVAPGAAGYRGQLRPVGGAFAAEGAVLAVNTVLVGSEAHAEVELATTFAPGDNFRVVASLSDLEVGVLNDTTDVGTTGSIALFSGAVTDQLSIWRRLHIEQDVMANVVVQLQQGAVAGGGVGAPNAQGERIITTNINIAAANSYIGGTLRDSAGGRFLIVGNTAGAGSTVTVSGGVPAIGAISIATGDHEPGNATANAVNANGTVTVTTNINIAEANQYNGGILRTAAGANLPIISHTTGAASTVTIAAPAAIPIAGITLYEDDFGVAGSPASQGGSITAQAAPAGGQVVLTTNATVLNADEFNGGTLIAANGTAYPIVSHTTGANAQFTVTSAAALPAAAIGAITVFGNLGAGVPVLLTQPSNAGVYDMLQESTVRADNRYADAYLQPELDSLDAFDTNNVTPWAHFNSGLNSGLTQVADAFRGQTPGGPEPRPANYETDFFWNVYVLVGFEGSFSSDADPHGGIGGVTSGAGVQDAITVVHVEDLRDRTAQGQLLDTNPLLHVVRPVSDPLLVNIAKTTVHEIGHQLNIATGVGPNEHRGWVGNNVNIMSAPSSLTPQGNFYLDPIDTASIRQRHQNPLLVSDHQVGTTSPGNEQPVDSLSRAELLSIVEVAMQNWLKSGVQAEPIATLSNVEFVIDDLPEGFLAQVSFAGDRVTVDIDASGYGWFVDATPNLNEEYVASGNSLTEMHATSPEAIAGIDLLTVVTHELGHVFGLEDLSPETNPGEVMTGTLPRGVRRTIEAATSPFDGSASEVAFDTDVTRRQYFISPYRSDKTQTPRIFARQDLEDERRRTEAIWRRYATEPISEETFQQVFTGYGDLYEMRKRRDEDDDSVLDFVFRDYGNPLSSFELALEMEDDGPEQSIVDT